MIFPTRRIVLICNEFPPRPHAGIGTAVQTIAYGLSRKGHAVTVVGLGDGEEEHTDDKIRVFTLERNKRPLIGNLASRIRLRNWLNRYIKKEKVDLVEVPDSSGLLPFGSNGCATVVRLHLSFTAVNRVTGEKAGKAISFFERQTLSRSPNWIAVSNSVRDLTQSAFGVTPRRCVTIYNPVLPLSASLPELPELPANYILYAGNVCRRKGADVLAEAARGILAKSPDLHLVYAGGVFAEFGRPISGDILKTVGQDLAGRVHFLGRVDRLRVLTCMKRARVFAFPSHVEGFPMVVLEAMSCGVPVVYSKHPPGPEIIEHGLSGLLADPLNPKDFGAAVSRVLDNPVLAKTLGEAGRKRVGDLFTVEKCVGDTERFYNTCLGN
jgi:glycosyltransferase involved in cell wall biosynthesis